MTNDEIRRNDEMRMRKPATAQLRVFRHSGFGFHSSFVIQRLVQVRFMVPMHGIQVVKALHEPTVRSPGFSRSGPPEGGTPNKWRPHGLVHGPKACEKRMEAFHAPERTAG